MQQALYPSPPVSPMPSSLSTGASPPGISVHHASPWPGLQLASWLGPGLTSVCTRLTLWARSSRTQLKMSTTPSFSAMSSMVSMAMKQPVLPAPALEERTVVYVRGLGAGLALGRLLPCSSAPQDPAERQYAAQVRLSSLSPRAAGRS